MSTGLFQDEEDGYNIEETKYKLKLGNEEPDDADLGGLEDLGDAEAEEEGLGGLEDLGGEDLGGVDDKPFDDEPFDAGVEADEEEDPSTYIQQLAGKLGQSLRKYTDEQGGPDFDLEKFAINSVISATHTAEMDAEDQKDIIKKIKSSGKGEGDVDVDVNVDTGDEEADLGDVNVDAEGGEEGLRDMDFGEEEPQEENFNIAEQENPCWKGYEMVGMKNKDGKEVPNCVPVKENLEKSQKNHKFVDKEYFAKKLKEHHNMDYKNYGKYDRDEYMLDEPDIKEAPVKEPEVVPHEPKVKPSRRQKPWKVRPNVNPNPKADDGKDLIMSEEGSSYPKIADTKYMTPKEAILSIDVDGNMYDVKFENTEVLNRKPNAHDEPWVYEYKSVDSPDGKEYTALVDFYGHPDTHLELSGIHDDELI